MKMPERDFYEQVPVPDGLAGERTFLAAERTLLAYARTAFAIFVAGITGSQLLTDPVLMLASYILAALAIPVFGVGAWRYTKSRKATRRLLERLYAEHIRRN